MIIPAGQESDDREKRTENSSGRLNFRSFVVGAVTALAAVAVFFTVYFLLPFKAEPSSPAGLASFKKIAAIQSLIKSEYYGDINTKDEADTMYLGLVSGLGDKYSAYYTKEQYEQIKMDNDGQMKGIGVSITADSESGYIIVRSVVKDSPAEKAGVRENDLITEILGESTEGMDSSDAVNLIQGSESDEITISVRHEGSSKDVELTMTKSVIEREVVSSEMLDGDIGYIAISSFNRKTEPQFSEAYDSLNDKKMKGLIIDLRDNLGGLVDACVDTLSDFMPEGVMVYERGKDGKEVTRECAGDSPISIPVVVLVNENTASASEMFTGAVQDYGVGTVVGTQTYGKGIEQNSYTLSDGSVVKLTTDHYFTPDHNDINGVGITPDVEAEADEDSDTDVQLEKAIETVKGMESKQ